MSVGLSIHLDSRDEWVIIRAEGKLDAITMHTLEKKIDTLLQEEKLDIMLDCSKLSSISSSALRYLLSATQKISKQKGHFVLFAIKEKTLELINVSGFDKLLHIASSESQALQMRHKP